MELKVYCIIVTYNAMRWIDRCLLSLRDSTVDVFPVVIDNCSEDGTVNYIQTHYPEAHIIVNKTNKGFGQANNQGIEWAYKQGATSFFLLNQDAWVYQDSIKKMAMIQEQFDLDVVSPIHLNGKGDQMDYGFFAYSVLLEKNNEWVSDILLNKQLDYYIINFVNAAGWMIRRKTIDEIGGFDPLFFHYGEDVNYCQRLQYHNKRMAIIPQAFMHHDREVKGNVSVYNKRKYISSLLLQYSNVNGKNKDFMKARLVSCYNMTYNIFTCRWKEFWNEFTAYFSILRLHPKIKNSKKKNSVIQPNWLNII